MGEICAKYLAKGRKVAVVGSVSVQTYTGNDGQTRASLEVNADDVEFLTPKGEGDMPSAAPAARQQAPVGSTPQGGGFVQVDEEDLPF